MLTRLHGSDLHLTAALFSPDGAHRVDIAGTVPMADPEAAQHFAVDLLGRAPPAIRDHFHGVP